MVVQRRLHREGVGGGNIDHDRTISTRVLAWPSVMWSSQRARALRVRPCARQQLVGDRGSQGGSQAGPSDQNNGAPSHRERPSTSAWACRAADRRGLLGLVFLGAMARLTPGALFQRFEGPAAREARWPPRWSLRNQRRRWRKLALSPPAQTNPTPA